MWRGFIREVGGGGRRLRRMPSDLGKKSLIGGQRFGLTFVLVFLAIVTLGHLVLCLRKLANEPFPTLHNFERGQEQPVSFELQDDVPALQADSWRVAHTQSGEVYYWNERTRETSWVSPTARPSLHGGRPRADTPKVA